MVQSLEVILTTEIGERVQRRDFGTELPRLIDRPQNLDAVMDIYMVTVEAIRPRLVRGHEYGEPCFAATNIQVDFATPASPGIYLDGAYYPEGHRGDFTIIENRTARFLLIDSGEGLLIRSAP
ncbi:baseplate assembly protein [Aurantimonas sp. DM33-3]|uniref:baseplate assembly protein n=1 Tax=Aurantimonas sp. DM33-3 TaxID=2766955 RepID=UPI0016520156|nr:baseplate assembly protein [Aurantimonas sp. DM33-3]MBC6714793.1 baseplate assembly protein [Aurantimonas sp. DM33-3]